MNCLNKIDEELRLSLCKHTVMMGGSSLFYGFDDVFKQCVG